MRCWTWMWAWWVSRGTGLLVRRDGLLLCARCTDVAGEVRSGWVRHGVSAARLVHGPHCPTWREIAG